MSKFADWEQWRTCTRKTRFSARPTPADYPPKIKGAYRCRFCEGWHLTSKARKGRQKQEEIAIGKQSKELDRLEAYLTKKLAEADAAFHCWLCRRDVFDGDCAEDECPFAGSGRHGSYLPDGRML